MPELVCIKCEKPASLLCQRCHESYCSTECQVQDWKEHKNHCFQMPHLIPIAKVYHRAETSSSTQTGNILPLRRPSKVATDERNHSKSLMAAITVKSDNTNKDPECNLPSTLSKTQNVLLDEKEFTLKTTGKTKKPAWKCQYLPPTNRFVDVIVQLIEDTEHNSIFWVTETIYDDILRKLLSEMNRNIPMDAPVARGNISVGALVAAPLNGVLYRAEVLEVMDCKEKAIVRLVDYGNKIVARLNELFDPIPIMSNLNVYTFRVKVVNNSVPLEIESVISIRIVAAKSPDNLLLAEINVKSIPATLPTDVLKKNPRVIIKRLAKNGKIALAKCKASSAISEMNEYLNTEQGLKYDYASIPTYGSFVAARTSCGWQRACLMAYEEKYQAFLVYLLDEGHVEMCDLIKIIPDKYIPLPISVFCIDIQATASNIDLCDFESEGQLSVVLLNSESLNGDVDETSCTIYVEEKQICDAMATLFIGPLDDLAVNTWKEQRFADGSKIFITNVIKHSEVYISYVCTKQYADLLSVISSKCLPYIAEEFPNVGDIVLAQADNEVYFRAEIVAKCDSDTYNVRNIDTGVLSSIPRKCMRKANAFVWHSPVYLWKVKLAYLENITSVLADNKALEMLNKCQQNQTEFKVKVAMDKSDTVDLVLLTKDQQSLSKKLLPLLFESGSNVSVSPNMNLSSKSSKVDDITAVQDGLAKCTTANRAMPIEQNKQTTDIGAINLNVSSLQDTSITYSMADLETVPITSGDNVPLLVLDCSRISNGFITVVDISNKDSAVQMQDNLIMVSKYCKCSHIPKNGYKPKINEICLAVYSEDGEWYRALCVDVLKDKGLYLMVFFDYGNICEVAKKDLLPITKDLMFPSYANECYVKGLTKDQYTRFSKVLNVNPILYAKVYKSSDGMYNIIINNIDELLG